MKKLLFNFCLSLSLVSAFTLSKEIKQLLVVSLDHDTQNKAWLDSYVKSDGSWKKVFPAIAVSLGRNGIGLGLGLHDKSFSSQRKLKEKQEGDGKSPAGIFRLSSIFGYSPSTTNSKMPYIHLHSKLHCVDDSESKHYNKIISQTSGYKSFESMRRKDNLYELGIVVEHNTQALKGRGSCIFIHIQNPNRTPTSGCTTMRKVNLLKVIQWLDKDKHPILLQALKNNHTLQRILHEHESN